MQQAAKWVVAEGADAAALTRSIPIEKCLEDAMLVYSQNGERLRPQQGYPLRLLLPGFEGNMNVKWLRRLRVAAEPAYSREETSKYTDLMPDGSAREFTFYMEAKSIITRPSGGQRLSPPGSTRSAASPGAAAAKSSASMSLSMRARAGRKRSCRNRC